MLGEPSYTMNDLFAQLGLDNSDEAIDNFIGTHKLSTDQKLVEASIWDDKQRMFLFEEWKKDAAWALVIDELNVRLHPTA